MEGKSGGAGGCLAGARDKRALNATRCGTLHLAKDRVRRRLEPKEGEHTAEMGPAALKEAVAQAGGRRAGGDVARGRLCALQAGLRVSSPATHAGSEGSRKLRRQLPGTGPSRAGCAANGNGNAHQEVGTAPAVTAKAWSRPGSCHWVRMGRRAMRPRGHSAQDRQPGGGLLRAPRSRAV